MSILAMSVLAVLTRTVLGDDTPHGSSSATALLVRAGDLVEKVSSETARDALRARLKKIAALDNEAEEISQLKTFIADLSAASSGKEDRTAGSPNLRKEIAALNFLTEYLCILEDLDGRGFILVRRELTDNVDLTGVSPETARIFRRLIEACSEAERTAKNIEYVGQDGKDATGEVWGTEIGEGIGASLALGNPLPLIMGAGSAIKGTIKIDKDNERKRSVLIQNFNDRLSQLHFDVNARRSDLTAEQGVDANQFLTKTVYDSFAEALHEKDAATRKAALLNVAESCPTFREAQYYLAMAESDLENYADAERILQDITTARSPILRQDTFLGEVYNSLSWLASFRKAWDEMAQFATKAIQAAPTLSVAYSNRAVAYMNLNDGEKALKDVQKACELDPDSKWFCWTACRVIAQCYKNDEVALDCLAAAVGKGFNEFDKARNFPALRNAVMSQRGQYLMAPRLTAEYVAGVFNDDVRVTNGSAYDLTNVRLTCKITYRKDNQDQVASGNKEYACWRSGQQDTFEDMLSMPEDSFCRIELTFTSDQNPSAVTRTTLYNYGGKKDNVLLEGFLNNEARKVYENKDDAKYKDALDWARKSCDLLYWQDANSIDTYAHLLFVTGDKDNALKQEKEAIRLFKKYRPDNADGLKVYEDALRIFQQGQ
jgi:tetratricopeptide (TPR) repeat protein